MYNYRVKYTHIGQFDTKLNKYNNYIIKNVGKL